MDTTFSQQASEVGTQQAAIDYRAAVDKQWSQTTTPLPDDVTPIWDEYRKKNEAATPGWEAQYTKDYDLPGLLKANVDALKRGETFNTETEKIKYHKPNSPFFTDASVHYQPGMEAGSFDVDGGTLTFKPTSFMIAAHGRKKLEEYYLGAQKEMEAAGVPMRIAWPKTGGNGDGWLTEDFYLGTKIHFPDHMAMGERYKVLSDLRDEMLLAEKNRTKSVAATDMQGKELMDKNPVEYPVKAGTEYFYQAGGKLVEKDELAAQVAGMARASGGLVAMAPAWVLSLGVNAALAAVETGKEMWARKDEPFDASKTGVGAIAQTFGSKLHDTREFASKYGNALFDPDAFMEVTGLQLPEERMPDASDYYMQNNPITKASELVSYFPGLAAKYLAKNDMKGLAWLSEEGINLGIMMLLHKGVTYPKKVWERMTVRDALNNTTEGKIVLNTLRESTQEYLKLHPEKETTFFNRSYEKLMERKLVDKIRMATKGFNEKGGIEGGAQPSGWWEGSENKRLNLRQGTDKFAGEVSGFMRNGMAKDIEQRVKQREEAGETPKAAYQLEQQYQAVDQNLNNLLIEHLGEFGFDVKMMDNIKEKYGVDAIGVTDTFMKLVALKEGKIGMDTLPHETAHVLWDTLPLYLKNRITQYVNETPSIISKLAEKYALIYDKQFDKFLNEEPDMRITKKDYVANMLLEEGGAKFIADGILKAWDRHTGGNIGKLRTVPEAIRDTYQNVYEYISRITEKVKYRNIDVNPLNSNVNSFVKPFYEISGFLKELKQAAQEEHWSREKANDAVRTIADRIIGRKGASEGLDDSVRLLIAAHGWEHLMKQRAGFSQHYEEIVRQYPELPRIKERASAAGLYLGGSVGLRAFGTIYRNDMRFEAPKFKSKFGVNPETHEMEKQWVTEKPSRYIKETMHDLDWTTYINTDTKETPKAKRDYIFEQLRLKFDAVVGRDNYRSLSRNGVEIKFTDNQGIVIWKGCDIFVKNEPVRAVNGFAPPEATMGVKQMWDRTKDQQDKLLWRPKKQEARPTPMTRY